MKKVNDNSWGNSGHDVDKNKDKDSSSYNLWKII